MPLCSKIAFRRRFRGKQVIVRTGENLISRIKTHYLFLLVASLTVCSVGLGVKAATIHDGESLLAAMHDRYQNAWYKTVVFQEKAISINPDDTTKMEVWDEALQIPGKLRIDKGAAREGNGFIFSDGMLTTFQNGRPNEHRPYVHMLLVLGFDVYGQDPKTTIEQVRSQGFDLRQLHEETWEGEDVYVVGAAKGDLTSNQFWVERKRLLFVRLIQSDSQDHQKIQDSRFRDYQKFADAWISARVEFYTNGKNVFNEDYFNIKANVTLDPAIFNADKFAETKVGQYLGQ